jgi:hypothetical protein
MSRVLQARRSVPNLAMMIESDGPKAPSGLEPLYEALQASA